MAKGEHLHKHGLFGGWDEYRYGSRKKVTLAPIVETEERKAYINDVFDLMQNWRVTPFENEGAVRAGVRSALCLQGGSWPQADAEASRMVNSVFLRMGAKRPAWEEGQRGYSVAEENCAWCGVEVPDELNTGKIKSRYCSSVCARSALAHRDFEQRRTSDKAYANAHLTIQRLKNNLQTCKHCATLYRPLFEGGEFCSHECATKHSRRLSSISCGSCGAIFRPSNSARLYCSSECAGKARRVEQPTYECQQCGVSYTRPTSKGYSHFCSRECHSANMRVVRYAHYCRCCGHRYESRSKKSLYCSNSCLLRARRGKHPANVAPFVPAAAVTTIIFDAWFRMAA
jgi:hypothetical protein